MSPRLPVVSGRDVVRALTKVGFEHRPGGKGSHMKVVRASLLTILTVPDHPELAKGTLRALIRQAGLSVEQFSDLL